MEDFVLLEIAQKLKEKGFTCEMPFAMYNEVGQFCLLTTSAPYQVCESGYKCREYYDYYDFDKNDVIAPTISQVLKWLREDKQIALNIEFIPHVWQYKIFDMAIRERFEPCGKIFYTTYEEAAIAGIEYCLDNLI